MIYINRHQNSELNINTTKDVQHIKQNPSKSFPISRQAYFIIYI